MNRPRLQVLLHATPLTPEIRGVLNQVEADAEVHDFENILAATRPVEIPDVRLVLTGDAAALKNGRFARFLAWFDRQPCGTLIHSPASVDSAPSAEPRVQDRPIRFALNASPDQLLGELRGMCGMSRSYEALRRELEELKRKDESLLAGLRELQDELRRAGLLQRDLFQLPWPTPAGASLEVWHRAAAEVSGDVHHVARLDAENIGLAVADATGHGLAAGLLSVAIQRSFRALPRGAAGAPPSPPDVLARLNQEILDARLGECQFVTALYAVYHEPTRTVCWARAGAPHPLLIRSGRIRAVPSDGMLLGVRPGRTFEPVRLTLHPGDVLLFFTDGLENLLSDCRGTAPSAVQDSPWIRERGAEPLASWLGALDAYWRKAAGGPREIDDVTVLALHVPPTTAAEAARFSSASGGRM